MKQFIHFACPAVLLVAFTLVVGSVGQAADPAKPTRTKPVTTAPATKPTAVKPPAVAPHCQVPCGIYTDQLRFESMLEDTKTIAKSIVSINEFAESVGKEALTGKGVNQAMRWVNNKESHATKIQNVMAEYFLAQRIKSDNKAYVGQLSTAHGVIVAAMKCKQGTDPAAAEKLKAAILDFYRAYEGKEPEFHNEK